MGALSFLYYKVTRHFVNRVNYDYENINIR
jgi:hypothetical protein